MTQARTVAQQSELLELCERIEAAPRIGIDTEFHNERSFAPKLMVVQLAFEDAVVIVDPLALDDLRPLAKSVCARKVTGHALSSDLKILADRFDCVPSDIFDCQVAASFLGYGMAISLADLVHELCGVRMKKSQTVSDWSRRPLTEHQVDYLIEDVRYLLRMEDIMRERLERSGRLTWAMEECALLGDMARYQADPSRAAARISGANRMNRRELGVLSELLQMREQYARKRDVPLRYILPDDVLAGLAKMRPTRLEDLSQLRRLDANARKSYGAAILAAVRRGEELPEDRLPEKLSRPLGPSRDTLVSLMSVAAGEIAREQELPASLLAPRAALERVARELPGDRKSFERCLGLSHWRSELLLGALWDLVSGAASVRIEGYQNREPRIYFKS